MESKIFGVMPSPKPIRVPNETNVSSINVENEENTK